MLLLVLILAAACFAFTSHAVEAILVAQKTDTLEEYYSPIGYLTGKGMCGQDRRLFRSVLIWN